MRHDFESCVLARLVNGVTELRPCWRCGGLIFGAPARAASAARLVGLRAPTGSLRSDFGPSRGPCLSSSEPLISYELSLKATGVGLPKW
jgi:hypothetical protein